MSPLTVFDWPTLEPLLGRPMNDPHIQHVFARVGLALADAATPLTVGMLSAPAASPPTAREVDLERSHRVRLRFKPASEVGVGAPHDRALVLAAITWFVDPEQAGGGFAGSLPRGLRASYGPDDVERCMGHPPSDQDMSDPDDFGYLAWYDARPVVHVLFSGTPRRLVRVNVFLTS